MKSRPVNMFDSEFASRAKALSKVALKRAIGMDGLAETPRLKTGAKRSLLKQANLSGPNVYGLDFPLFDAGPESGDSQVQIGLC